MRFKVPQFIDVESKIIGPLSFFQLVYLVGSIAIVLGSIALFGTIIGIVIGTPFAVLGVSLAFYKHNNRPLSVMIENALSFFLSKKFYTWRKEDNIDIQSHLLRQLDNISKNKKVESLETLSTVLNIPDEDTDEEDVKI